MLSNVNSYIKLKSLLSLVLGFVIVGGAYIWFIQTPSFLIFKTWAEHNIVIFSIFLVTAKVLGIVIPPIPGGIFTLSAIPIIGWWQAYLLDFTGAMIGSSIAYFLGKRYGNKLLSKFFDQTLIQKIEGIKVKKHREVETVFFLRFFFGATVTEIVCYAAGLLHISYKNFIIGSIASHLLVGIPTYYIAQNILELKNTWMSGIIVLLAIPIFWKLRGRYLE